MTKPKKPSRPRTPSRRSKTSSPSDEPPELESFARFCRLLKVENGSPFELEPFQRAILADYFRGATETVAIVPKKNGKTTLLAALALYHLAYTDDAECAIVASSKKQAGYMYTQAEGFIRRSDALAERLDPKPGYKIIRSLRDAGKIDILAADEDTADGWIGTLALVDELHRASSFGLYGLLHDGLGPRDGRMVTISTAGSDTDSPLGELRAAAHQYKDSERVGAHLRARSDNSHFVLHEWALPDDADVDDMTVVKRANPASWQTEAKLQERHDSPTTTPFRWARFAAGIWLETEDPWISPMEWDDCEGELRLDDAEEFILGVDIGQIYDSSAVVTAGWVDKKLHVRARIWDPKPGKPIQITEVEAHVFNVIAERAVREVAYDPTRFNRSGESIEEHGVDAVEFPPSSLRRYVEASTTLYDLIRENRIVHDGDPTLRRHVLAGVPMEVEGGWRISKKKSKKKIDALIALALAAQRAVHNEDGPDLIPFEVI